MIKDNEAVYDEQIFPLMEKIIALCTEHDIPFLAAFEYAPDHLCTTNHQVDGRTETLDRALAAVARGRSPLMLTTRNADGDVVNSTVIL